MANHTQSPAVLTEDVRKLSRKEQTLEVSVFLFLIVPSMILALFVVGQGTQGFVVTAASVILRDLALCCLVLFFVWRNREPLYAIGWTSRYWPGQAALGILFFPVMFAACLVLAGICLKMGLSSPHSPLKSALSVRSGLQAPLALVLVAVVAVTEETIFRGYLILRFRAATGSTSVAVVLSTVVFASGHGYEGGVGLVTVGIMGLVFALVYLRTGSLVAPIVMHFLQDFIGIVVAPWLVQSLK